MSHELRTPLNGVIGYAQLLQRDRTLSRNQRDALDAISACGSHLLDLINDVLDLSKIEAGRMDIESTPWTCARWPSICAMSSKSGRSARGCSLSHIDPELSPRVVLDGRHVRQVLLNLLGNAIKFTPAGEVQLRITSSGAPSSNGKLRFDVIDTGIGIEAENLSAVFQAFRQSARARSLAARGWD